MNERAVIPAEPRVCGVVMDRNGHIWQRLPGYLYDGRDAWYYMPGAPIWRDETMRDWPSLWKHHGPLRPMSPRTPPRPSSRRVSS